MTELRHHHVVLVSSPKYSACRNAISFAKTYCRSKFSWMVDNPRDDAGSVLATRNLHIPVFQVRSKV